MEPVYVCLLEVKPLPGCELDPSTVEGAFVRCYVQATDPDEALSKAHTALQRDRFELVDTQWCINDDEAEWEDSINEQAARCVAEAQETGEVVYGQIDWWSHNEDDEPDGDS